MAWVPAQDDMAWKRASTGRGSMPPQKTSFEPHARQPDSFRKPRQGDLILFSQISSIRNEGRHETCAGIRYYATSDNIRTAHLPGRHCAIVVLKRDVGMTVAVIIASSLYVPCGSWIGN